MRFPPVSAAVCCITFAVASQAMAAPMPMKIARFSMEAKADLGDVTFTYHIKPTNMSANVGFQVFAHRDDLPHDQWDLIIPRDSSPPIISIYKGLDNTGTFTVNLNRGTYGATRFIMFNAPDGKNVDYGQVLWDSTADPAVGNINLHLQVKTSQERVTKPFLEVANYPQVSDNGNGTYLVQIPATVKVPQGFTIGDAGLWVMAKGDGGFDQEWAGLKSAEPGGDPLDDYNKIPVTLKIKNAKPGIWNFQFGLFTPSFQSLQWVYPGMDVELGGDTWEQKADPASIPPRLRVENLQFRTLDGKPYDFYADNPAGKAAVSFVRGGNYGNAIGWTIHPEYDRAGYFVLLGSLGLHYVRVVFNPDRYIDPQDPLYQHVVDQVVQNIWAAGLYPVIGPQDLPKGDTLDERVEKGLKAVQAMATRYKGKSVWLELANEPHEFDTWAAWKPVAERYTKALRAIDPDALVIVPLESWGKDGRGAAKDPITDVPVDLYDGHAYVNAEDVAKLYAPMIEAHLPLMLGEYGGGDPAYLSRMDQAIQALPPGLMAAGPWAFTIKGQDSLPLVEDGSTAVLKLNPNGDQIARDYAAWDAGKKAAPRGG